MEEFMNSMGDANFAGYASAFIAGFFIGKKVASMGFIFMLVLAVGGYYLYQTYAGGVPAE